jgi:hypothetical protein
MQINNSMQENNKTPSNHGLTDPVLQKVQPQGKPNEAGKLYIDGVVKIHDPNTKEVYLETRA